MHLPLTKKPNGDDHPVITSRKKLTLSQKAADVMTQSMGSWSFIIISLIFLTFWMSFNVYALVNHIWDPYPFILLNLVLSMVSALQGPIIMMSQNRQAELDRLQAKYDYAVNRKVDREVQSIQKDLDEIKAILQKSVVQTKKNNSSK